MRRVLLSGIVIVTIATVAFVATRSSEATAPTTTPVCDGFDFPVGPPDGTGYYDAQPFGDNDHLGADWNGVGGGDSDLGDPVFAVSSGIVLSAADHGGGWGPVVRIKHPCASVESLYAHLDTVEVIAGMQVTRGQRIGTIGTAHGQYRAHLHFEIRDRWLPLGGGYSTDRRGYLDPTTFIRMHR